MVVVFNPMCPSRPIVVACYRVRCRSEKRVDRIVVGLISVAPTLVDSLGLDGFADCTTISDNILT